MSGGAPHHDGESSLGEIGRIQSCGYVVAFEEDAGCPSGVRVVGASDNLVRVRWIHASCQAELLGQDLGQAVREEWVGVVRSLVARHKQACKPHAEYMAAKANRNTVDVRPPGPAAAAAAAAATRTRTHTELVSGVSREESEEAEAEELTLTLSSSSPGVYLLELEPKDDPLAARSEDTPGLLQVADLLACVPVGANPKASTSALCDALAACLTSYDRAMVIRLHQGDGSAEVIHESIQPGFELQSSYLGLRFPGTDIPQNGRDMLKLVGARFIADTSDTGVPVTTFHGRSTGGIDLSLGALRSSPECHLRFLRNMGVRASLVVAIVVDGGLWGFFDLHSYTAPVHPSCEERIMAEMAATVTASLISRHQREEVATTAFALSRVLGNLHGYPGVQEFLSAEHEELLRILDVDTILLVERSPPVHVFGDKDNSLTFAECKDLIDDGGDPSDREVIFKAHGLAYFTVRSCLVGFQRRSAASRVAWAGKPDRPRVAGEQLGPRSSFERYVETAAATFRPWSPATSDLVRMVHHTFSSQLFAQSLPFDLQETFAQVSHELRTPFHGVLGALELLQTERDALGDEEQQGLLQSAVRNANLMMGTLDAILDIAKDRNNVEAAQCRFAVGGPVLATISAMKPFADNEAVGLVADTTLTAGSSGELEVVGDSRRIKGILQNLVNNAIKFTPVHGKVRVSLVVLDSVQGVVDWWAKEAGRFDAREWIVRPPPPMDGDDPDDDDDDDNDAAAVSAAAAGPTPSSSSSSSRSTKKWYGYCVEDSGVGVSALDLPHLATAYRQVSRGSSRSHAGTGLGLHICKEYVGILDGACGVASTLSKKNVPGGTLFALVVPLRLAVVGEAGGEAGAPADGAEKEESAFRRWGGEMGGSRKIAFLVVDDQRVNLKLLERKILQHFNGIGVEVEVITADDGLTALEAHAAKRIAAAEHGDGVVLAGIFVDFHMPGLDGFECARRIRQVEAEHRWPRIFVCGYTADATESSREIFKDTGGDDVVRKPWHSGQVEAVCNAMVATALGLDHKRSAPGI